MVNLHPPPAANRGDEIFPDQGFLWGGGIYEVRGCESGRDAHPAPGEPRTLLPADSSQTVMDDAQGRRTQM